MRTQALVMAVLGSASLPSLPQPPTLPSVDVPARNVATTFLGHTKMERCQGISRFVQDVGGHDEVRYLVAGEADSIFPVTGNSPWAVAAQAATPADPTFNGGDNDGYLAIVSEDFSQLLHWTYIGGALDDRAYYAETDGNWIYVVGLTESEGALPTCGGSGSFPATSCIGSFGSPGDFDVFVARFNMNLTQLQACLVVGGSAEDTPRGSLLVVPGATATDTRVYVSGRTASSNFPVAGLSPSMTPYQSSPGGGHDAFLFKLDSLLLPVWGTYLGGSGDDFANANVRVDGDHVFIAGCAKSPRSSFSPALPSGGAQSDLAGTMGLEDGFVARFSASAGTLDAFTYLGGEDRDYVSSNDVLELTTTGKPVVAGITRSRCLPVVNAVFPLHSGCASGTPCANCPAPPSTDAGNDAFVGRLSADLGTLEFLSYVGGTDREEPAGLAVDRIGNVYLTGETASSDFPITLARAFDTSFTPSAPAAWNMAFLVKLSTSPPSSLDYSSFFGGDVNAGGTTQLGTRGRSLMLLPSGDALLSGVTTTSDLPATSGVVFVSYQTGVTDGFVTVHFVN